MFGKWRRFIDNPVLEWAMFAVGFLLLSAKRRIALRKSALGAPGN